MTTPAPDNHATFSLDELAALEGATVIRGGEGIAVGVSTDTRTLRRGALFVALRGERFDGHRFLDRAIALGARCLVVSDAEALAGVEASIPVVLVPDTLAALGALAHLHRERMEREGALRLVVAITGSVGKTTTRQMCAAVLRARGHAVHETLANLNNLVGVPLTLLAIEPAHTAAVLEVGMSVPGEIAQLARLVRPHVGVVTSVARVHTEGLGSLEAVAREKAALLDALEATPAPGRVSIAIHTVDDRVLVPLAAASPAPMHLGTGRHPDADVRLHGRRLLRDGVWESRYTVRPLAGLTATDVEVRLKLAGEGAARDAAIALALAVAIEGPQALGRAAEALGRLSPAPGRGALLEGPRGSLVLDETYNASRASVENALEAGRELARARAGRLIAVLGDMLELGPYEDEEHDRVLAAASAAQVELLVVSGPRMRRALDRSPGAWSGRAFAEEDPLLVAGLVREFVRSEDVVVVKGSRGMRMERVLAPLGALPEAAREGG